VLAILNSFFGNALEFQYDQESNWGRTLHVSAYVRQFLFSAAVIICWEATDLISAERDRIVTEVTWALKDFLDNQPPTTTSPDYLFYTAFMFANSLLRANVQSTRGLYALVTVLLAYRERVQDNLKLQHYLDLNHPHYRWDAFRSLIDARGIVLPRTPDSGCLPTSTLAGSQTIYENESHCLDSEAPTNDACIDIVDTTGISETTSNSVV